MLVEDVMTTGVVTVPVDRSLREAVERMLDHEVGSVVVTEDGNHVGIVTETDVLEAGHRTGRPFEEIPIGDAMSRPVITVAPGKTVRAAVELLNEHGIKKLPVADGIELVGIVTMGDIVRHHSLLISEAIHEEERRREWESDEE